MKKFVGWMILLALVLPVGLCISLAEAEEQKSLVVDGCWEGNVNYPLWERTELSEVFADISSAALTPDGEILINTVAVRRVGRNKTVTTVRFNHEGSGVFNEYTQDWIPFEQNRSYERLWQMAAEELTKRGDIKG